MDFGLVKGNRKSKASCSLVKGMGWGKDFRGRPVRMSRKLEQPRAII